MTLQDKIEYCLKKHPKTVNSDILLTRAVWYEFHNSKLHTSPETGKPYVFLEDLMDLPREYHIKRVRAKFNALGLYLPTDPEVIRKRKQLEKRWREDMSPSNPSLY